MAVTLEDKPDNTTGPELTPRQMSTLLAVASGCDRVRQVAISVGCSEPTARRDLDQLELAGLLATTAAEGRGNPQQLSLSKAGVRLAGDAKTLPAVQSSSPTAMLPIGMVWIRASKPQQSDFIERLRLAGANSVFDALGDADVIATYPVEIASDMTALLREIAQESTEADARHALVVGLSQLAVDKQAT